MDDCSRAKASSPSEVLVTVADASCAVPPVTAEEGGHVPGSPQRLFSLVTVRESPGAGAEGRRQDPEGIALHGGTRH